MAKRIMLKDYRRMDTTFSRTRGLMFEQEVRKPLLFIFPYEVSHSFHSMFCPDFDIVFLNGKREVVYSEKIRSAKIIEPGIKYRYVVEAFPGFIAKNKIKNKIKIEF